MTLESFQKVADLLLKGVAATAIAAGGLYVSLNKNKLDQGSVCLGMSEKLFAQVDVTLPLELRQRRLGILIDRYSDACGSLSANETEFLMNSLAPTRIVSAEGPPEDPRILGHGTGNGVSDPIDKGNQAVVGSSGWVAIGRVGGSYGQVNFDNAEGLLQHPLPKPTGAMLKARWSVNVRSNTSNTKLGENKVLAVLEAGECVESGDLTEVRGQVWTMAKVVDCK